jgi:hypothetical protein
MICRMAEPEIVKMLTTREVAEKLDANPGTVRMWCINGTFPNAKQQETARGPIWLIPETDLREFKRRGPGRPSKADARSDRAGQSSTSGDHKAATAKPKRRVSNRTAAKKALKKMRKKAAGN